jgi:NAD(P)-dependent dehydrogenase (short-subunit alcohol dehydrogenase family)
MLVLACRSEDKTRPVVDALSKLANVLFTTELALRLGPKGVHAYALHPGVVKSEAWRRVPRPLRPLMTAFMISSEQGARTSLYCATSPEVSGDNGLYYDRCKVVAHPNPRARDLDLARALWAKSAEYVGADLA